MPGIIEKFKQKAVMEVQEAPEFAADKFFSSQVAAAEMKSEEPSEKARWRSSDDRR